ncbi:MAG: hypothetical protein ACK40G_17285 [Cytophagaceae bacterium]
MGKEIDSDYSQVLSKDAEGNPLEIAYYKGGQYDPLTETYSGGICVGKEYLKYDADNDFEHEASL